MSINLALGGGRRNWLFSDTVPGANASARLYSLIETAKANSLEPYAYLRHVFTELPKAQSLADIEALLPTRLDPAALTRTPSKAPPSMHVNSAVPGALTMEETLATGWGAAEWSPAYSVEHTLGAER